MIKANDIVNGATDKFNLHISKMDKLNLEEYSDALKTNLKTEKEHFDRVMFVLGQKDLTVERYLVLLPTTEHDKTKLQYFNKPKMQTDRTIIEIPMVRYLLYGEDLKFSQMVRSKGFIVSDTISNNATNEELMAALNEKDSQINSILDGNDMLTPIKTDFKDVQKAQKEINIADRFVRLSECDKKIIVLKFKIELIRIQLSELIADNRSANVDRLAELKKKYMSNAVPVKVVSIASNDAKIETSTMLKNGVEQHKHEGIKGYHNVTTSHKDKSLHEGIANITTILTEFK